jgi:hypothetical protein
MSRLRMRGGASSPSFVFTLILNKPEISLVVIIYLLLYSFLISYLFMYFFIFVAFNDAVSSIGYIASNDKMIRK